MDTFTISNSVDIVPNSLCVAVESPYLSKDVSDIACIFLRKTAIDCPLASG